MEHFIPDEPGPLPAPFTGDQADEHDQADEPGQLDPDCRDGKHRSCVGDGCACSCHAWEVELDPSFAELLTAD